MKLRDRLRVPFWLAPRAFWCIAAIALLFAAGGAAASFLWLGYAAAVCVAVAAIADAVLGPRAGSLRIERKTAEPFSLRRRAELRYHIRNASRTTVLAGLLEAPVHLLNFDVDELRVSVPPESETVLERPVTPVARGSGNLDEIYVWFENPIGLIRRRKRLSLPAAIRVYPDLSAVERYGTLHVRNRLVESGLRKMRLRGAGTEPESVREFGSGDPFRAINWKATARRGRLMVAQYEVERSQNVMILLDSGRLMTPRVGDQRKFDYAVTAALSVASIASLASDKVGVVAFSSEIRRAFAPRAAGRSLASVAEELYDLEPAFEESDYDRAFAYVRAHVRKRSLVIFFTDMVDPAAQSSVLAQIGTLCRQHLVVCAFMNDAAIDRALSPEQHEPPNAYTTAVALELRDERRTAAATLARLGVQVIDVPAGDLTTALIDRYLRIKQRGLL